MEAHSQHRSNCDSLLQMVRPVLYDCHQVNSIISDVVALEFDTNSENPDQDYKLTEGESIFIFFCMECGLAIQIPVSLMYVRELLAMEPL